MKKTLLAAMSFVLVFAIMACNQTAANTPEQSGEGTPTTGGEKITVYISGEEAMINKLEETFEQQNGDVCDFVIMSCGELRSKVWTESEAGTIQADVIFGSDPFIYNKLDDKDLLEPLEISELSSIKEQYIVEGKNYGLVCERYIIIMYNTKNLEGDAPESYEDLADDKFNGLVTMADATQSSTAFAIAASVYELKGGNDDYFQKLKDNGVILAKSNGLVPSTIMEGQFAVGIAPHDAVVRLKNKGAKEGYEVPIETVWPSEGAIAIQRPVAIPVSETRSAEKEAIAKKLVNFLFSKQAQTTSTPSGK